MKKIENVIFDFGNVLCRYNPEYMISRFLSVPEDIEAVKKAMYGRDLWDRLDDGTISDEEVKRIGCERLPERLHAPARASYDAWEINMPGVPGMRELTVKLKESGKKVFLLSNISVGFSQKWKNIPELKSLLAPFDGLVFSGPLGIVKPSADIFRYLMSKYALDAEKTVFIDDTKKNLVGAEAVGIRGIHFDGNAETLGRLLLEEEAELVLTGRFRHFKGKEYEVIGLGTHTETGEPLVIYRALYGENRLWVRPASMWNDTVEKNGKKHKRFTYIGD